MSTTQVPALDMNKLNAFIGQFVTDLGAAVHTGMVVIGEKLGLYKALAGDPMTSAQLAAKTKTDERYVREWLASQAAGGYITYEAKTGKFSLTEEQAFALAREDSPFGAGRAYGKYMMEAEGEERIRSTRQAK